MVNIIVERVPEIYTCCDTLITSEDVASAVRFQNERRRREHLAWRRIVRKALGRDVRISYNEIGAPVVDRANTYISVSHSSEVVAVAIAECPIGIDIESSKRDFEHAKSRFMSRSEELLSSDSNWGAYVWTAKEALYKLYGRREIELIGDLRIDSFDSEHSTMLCTLAESEKAMVEISHYAPHFVVAVATMAKF